MAASIKTTVTSTNKRSLQSMICRLNQKVAEHTEKGEAEKAALIQQRLDSAKAQIAEIVAAEPPSARTAKAELTDEQKAARDATRKVKLAELGLKKAIEAANGLLTNGTKAGARADEPTAADLTSAVESATTWLGNTDADGITNAAKQLRAAIKAAKSNIKAATTPAKTEEPAVV